MADKVRKVAVEIANELFTNGSGEHAKHLNLIMDGGRYVGGWCEAAVADIIERKIRAAQQGVQSDGACTCALIKHETELVIDDLCPVHGSPRR